MDGARSIVRRKLVIFDFDGTLANSLPWFLAAFDHVAERFQFEKLDRSQLSALRSLDARQLLAHHRVPLWKVPAIIRYIRKLMQHDVSTIPLFPNIETALEALQTSGADMAVMSSNSRANVLRILGPRNAARFRYLKCGSSLFGKGTRLRRLLDAAQVAREEAIFVGDEIRDLRAAEQAGIAFGAVGWGYTHLPALIAHGAAETFASVEELVTKLAPA